MSNPLKVVVVDDEADIFKLYEIFLKKEIKEEMIELLSFEGGQGCLDYLESSNDSDLANTLIFTDINMPEMDGYQLLGKIKESWNDIPVYMVSAYGREDYIIKAKEMGAEELIPKPVDFEIIKNIIIKYGK